MIYIKFDQLKIVKFYFDSIITVHTYSIIYLISIHAFDFCKSCNIYTRDIKGEGCGRFINFARLVLARLIVVREGNDVMLTHIKNSVDYLS